MRALIWILLFLCITTIGLSFAGENKMLFSSKPQNYIEQIINTDLKKQDITNVQLQWESYSKTGAKLILKSDYGIAEITLSQDELKAAGKKGLNDSLKRKINNAVTKLKEVTVHKKNSPGGGGPIE